MTVADVQRLVLQLQEWLTAVGGKQVAADLARFADGLGPFADRSVADFCDLLNRAADPPAETPKAGKGRTRPADPERIRVALAGLRAMSDRATDPDLTYDAIRAEIDRLAADLTKDEGLEVAREFGVSVAGKSKVAALQEVGSRISDRKAMHDKAARIGLD